MRLSEAGASELVKPESLEEPAVDRDAIEGHVPIRMRDGAFVLPV
jgi:hypothetical protein